MKSPVDLSSYGIRGVVRHTAGSISVLLDSKEALVGDLIASGILLGGIVSTDVAKSPPLRTTRRRCPSRCGAWSMKV
jgi:hydroxyacylglutathione hydrolase